VSKHPTRLLLPASKSPSPEKERDRVRRYPPTSLKRSVGRPLPATHDRDTDIAGD